MTDALTTGTAEAVEAAGGEVRVSGQEPGAQEVLVLDFGGQYSQLIARRVRECGVFSELLPHHVSLEEVKRRAPRGLILSGGPASVYSDGAPKLRPELLELGVPVLGICYGMQAMALELGGRVEGASVGEFGRSELHREPAGPAVRGAALGPELLDEPPRHRVRGAAGRRGAGVVERVAGGGASRTCRAACTASSSTRRSCTRRTAARCCGASWRTSAAAT